MICRTWLKERRRVRSVLTKIIFDSLTAVYQREASRVILQRRLEKSFAVMAPAMRSRELSKEVSLSLMITSLAIPAG